MNFSNLYFDDKLGINKSQGSANMNTILFGNLISALAAAFMIVGCLSNTKARIFFYQVIQCLILTISYCVFSSWTGAITSLFSVGRNYLLAKSKFSKKAMWIFLGLIIGSTFLVKDHSLVSLLPVFATVEYTLCCYYVKSVKGTKLSIFFNLTLWITYSFLIKDFSTGITDFAVLLIDVLSLARMYWQENQLACKTH